MLAFEIVDKHINFYFDEAGMALFLNAMEKSKGNGHVHLCSPLCGGRELSD